MPAPMAAITPPGLAESYCIMLPCSLQVAKVDCTGNHDHHSEYSNYYNGKGRMKLKKGNEKLDRVVVMYSTYWVIHTGQGEFFRCKPRLHCTVLEYCTNGNYSMYNSSILEYCTCRRLPSIGSYFAGLNFSLYCLFYFHVFRPVIYANQRHQPKVFNSPSF
jgi:hypothetical protein